MNKILFRIIDRFMGLSLRLHKIGNCMYCNNKITDSDSWYDNVGFDEEGFIYHKWCRT